jgi:hypothetical protein
MKINRLTGKDIFTISDLVKVLSKFDQDAKVNFGTITEKCCSFSQNDNFIFKLYYNSQEEDDAGRYEFHILTEHK